MASPKDGRKLVSKLKKMGENEKKNTKKKDDVRICTPKVPTFKNNLNLGSAFCVRYM